MIWAIYTDAFSTIIPRTFSVLGYLSPFILGFIVWRLWLYYIRYQYVSKIEWVDLEVKLPREIFKSPKAMEIVLSGLQQGFEGDKWLRYWEGTVRSWFSLELYSDGGKIHFILHVPKFFRNFVESQVYSQYPEVEIHEVGDYTQDVRYGTDLDWKIWGRELSLTKEDAYPIKTYIDYGMDKDPKEEFKVDPMTPLLELLGSIGPGEKIWVQIMLVAAQKRFKKKGTWFEKGDWTDQGKELIAKLMKRDELKKIKAEGGQVSLADTILSPGEKDVVEALGRSLSKIGFDCGIRFLYLAKKDIYSIMRQAALLSAWKHFNSNNLNGFKPEYDVDYQKRPWKYIKSLANHINTKRRTKIFEHYRRRAYFYPPYFYPPKPFVLNTEELATIYHFPGIVAATPTLEKMGSKKTDAPVNLPI